MFVFKKDSISRIPVDGMTHVIDLKGLVVRSFAFCKQGQKVFHNILVSQ